MPTQGEPARTTRQVPTPLSPEVTTRQGGILASDWRALSTRGGRYYASYDGPAYRGHCGQVQFGKKSGGTRTPLDERQNIPWEVYTHAVELLGMDHTSTHPTREFWIGQLPKNIS